MGHSKLYDFFFADNPRIIIIVLIMIATILFLSVLGITLSIRKKIKNKFKLVYIIMINVMITAILEPVSYLLNWTDKHGNLLFGEQDDFLCQSQAFSISFFQSSREIFVTLISIITFISFKFGNSININSKLSLVLVLLVGYLIPLAENMIYLLIKGFGQSHLFCFTKIDDDISKHCGEIHLIFIFILIIINIFFTSILIIGLSCCTKKEEELESWIKDDNTEKYCIHPILKKIIFFPIAQFITMSIPFIYRFKDFIANDNPQSFAGPAAVVNSASSILYTLIFVISNQIFTAFRKIKEEECSDFEESSIELEEQ